MINQITVNKLREMRLGTMADALKSQSGDEAYDTLSFEDRFGILVDAEWSQRRSVKLQKLIYNAGFPEAQACIQGIDYLPETFAY